MLNHFLFYGREEETFLFDVDKLTEENFAVLQSAQTIKASQRRT